MKNISFFSMLFLAPFSLSAAQQLTLQQAEQIKPFKEISIRGLYYSIYEYQRAISSAADRAGADAYYIKDVQLYPANDRMRVITADLYKNNAEKTEPKVDKNKETPYPLQDGIYEYDKTFFQTHEYSKIVHVKGYFPTPLLLKRQVIKRAQYEGAAGFYIYKVAELGANQEATVFLFNKNAAKVAIQMNYDDIPLDSTQSTQTRADIIQQNKINEHSKINKANQEALAQADIIQQNKINEHSKINKTNQEALSQTTQVQTVKTETPKIESIADIKSNPTKESVIPISQAVDSKVSNETSSAAINESTQKVIEPKRYTVTLADGEKIQELSDATALKMIPFKTITFKGYFGTPVEISKMAAKKAAENNAKFYHIARISLELSGGRKQTVHVELYN